MIVGALPLSETFGGSISPDGWRQLKSGWPNLERRAQPIPRRENASNTIAGLLSWLTCPVPPGARKGPGNQT